MNAGRPHSRWNLALWRDRKFRFLVIGGGNTLFGYGLFPLLYYLMERRIHYIWIQVICTVTSITVSYLTQKLFVFRTRGNHLQEYFRFYLVNAVPIILSFTLFPLMKGVLQINAYVAMVILMVINTIATYVGHSHFSFRSRQRVGAASDMAPASPGDKAGVTGP